MGPMKKQPKQPSAAQIKFLGLFSDDVFLSKASDLIVWWHMNGSVFREHLRKLLQEKGVAGVLGLPDAPKSTIALEKAVRRYLGSSIANSFTQPYASGATMAARIREDVQGKIYYDHMFIAHMDEGTIRLEPRQTDVIFETIHHFFKIEMDQIYKEDFNVWLKHVIGKLGATCIAPRHDTYHLPRTAHKDWSALTNALAECSPSPVSIYGIPTLRTKTGIPTILEAATEAIATFSKDVKEVLAEITPATKIDGRYGFQRGQCAMMLEKTEEFAAANAEATKKFEESLRDLHGTVAAFTLATTRGA